MWFMTSKKDIPLNYKELPIDQVEIERIPDPATPRTMIQALMQAMPGFEEKISQEEPTPIKDALLESMELLTDQDKYIIDAVFWEQITFEELGKRLRSIGSACMEIDRCSKEKSQAIIVNEHHTKEFYSK